ncbi:MAG TPA: glutamate--tRNA ligase [Peptococcaceae bacterium]|nr:glutamate--tRNA ligase [Peptococcaceae bacterium]
MLSNVRVRFAPSPTGSLHIGGARTALFNWLFARHHQGKFIIRIDDTDLERSTIESAQEIISALKWLGLDWDEGPEVGGPYGPYFQSERLKEYEKAAHHLLARGLAYYCYCTPEELQKRRQEALAAGRAPRYDGRCRHLSREERIKLEREGRKPVIRFRIPEKGTTVVNDLIRGDVSFDHEILDDFIIIKSNGIPTYNFACVIDDIKMKITHILRAEEHLSNTPRQILIYQALEEPLPAFAHLPMILAPDRSKLSKRHGATSVEEFRDQGYLPEALLNYLALLGWSPEGEQEILSLSEMVRQFSLERVAKTAAIYDIKKLTWINGHYLNEADLDRVTKLAIPFLQKRKLVPEEISEELYHYIKEVVGLVRTRVKTLEEVAEAAEYFFTDDFSYDEKGVQKHFQQPGAAEILKAAKECLEKLDSFDLESVEKAYRELSAAIGVKTGEIIHPTRLALSGRTMGPGLFEMMVLLGKEKTIQRLSRAIDFISSREN